MWMGRTHTPGSPGWLRWLLCSPIPLHGRRVDPLYRQLFLPTTKTTLTNILRAKVERFSWTQILTHFGLSSEGQRTLKKFDVNLMQPTSISTLCRARVGIPSYYGPHPLSGSSCGPSHWSAFKTWAKCSHEPMSCSSLFDKTGLNNKVPFLELVPSQGDNGDGTQPGKQCPGTPEWHISEQNVLPT